MKAKTNKQLASIYSEFVCEETELPLAYRAFHRLITSGNTPKIQYIKQAWEEANNTFLCETPEIKIPENLILFDNEIQTATKTHN
jgi:hypothetical protein